MWARGSIVGERIGDFASFESSDEVIVPFSPEEAMCGANISAMPSVHPFFRLRAMRNMA
jgi:hypothetical protein